MNRIARDDRVLPETRVVSALIVPFLIVGFVILYHFPDDTGRLFAWTIEPSMTPLVMGAVELVVGLIMFLWPGLLIPLWPWS